MNLTELAVRIDQLAKDVDPHEYQDTVDDREGHIEQIRADLRNRKLKEHKEFCRDVINEDLELIPEAETILKILDKLELWGLFIIREGGTFYGKWISSKGCGI